MRHSSLALLLCASLFTTSLAGCGDEAELLDHEKILSVPESETWTFPELLRPVYVVRTEANVPHIYAHNRRDLAFVQGFVLARDRYFMMDLSRRLGTGTLTELLGDAALQNDQESRDTGMGFVTDQVEAGLDGDLGEYADAFAQGINAYIERAKADDVPPPSELFLAQGLLGATSPTSLMMPFDRRSVAAMIAVILYESSYETGDVGRAATAQSMATLFEGQPNSALRRKGAIEDLWQHIQPIKPVSSAPGFGTAQPAADHNAGPGDTPDMFVPPALFDRITHRLDALQIRLQRDREVGYGSNAWAVSGAASTSGAGILSGDGHLSLAVPSILYQIGLDTSVFGRGDTHQMGLTIPGFPVLSTGTNGKVAWSTTQLMGDITDWYREELRLDSAGKPVKSKFDGSWRDLVQVDESYVIADVPLLESVGRTESWSRWETFDGRWIADIEGRTATADEPLGPGETLVNLKGDYVVPGDENGDGIITAISFDYAGFDAGSVLTGFDAMGHANDVFGYREALRGLVASSQNHAVADSHGNIMYSSYQAVPCRGYLGRNADGSWARGADPNLLLDGTHYGAFRIPIAGGVVDEEPGQTDPYDCVVPFEAMPMSINPASGFVATANNDPGGIAFDGRLENDDWYIGGPWDTGFRVDTISRSLSAAIADGTADGDKMAETQANNQSPIAALLGEPMLAAIDHARSLPASPTEPAEQRLAALYQADNSAIDEVQQRLRSWLDGGAWALSGVDTVYSPNPSADERAAAVATMIFNAWMSRVLQGIFDDEGLPGVFRPNGTEGRLNATDRFLRGRGADNPLSLSSFNPATGESIFFDVVGTDEVETSDEVILKALGGALEFLRSDPGEEPGTGGFGTSDMDQWLWGLRHYAKLESLLADFIGNDPKYSALTEKFAINTTIIPLADSLPADDPRHGLKWFPRGADEYCVDAGNPGTSGTSFSHGSGPVMRMVVELDGDHVTGRNIIPGGQSALTDSPYFADQARLWLANETLPLRFSVDDVVAGATSRETYNPN